MNATAKNIDPTQTKSACYVVAIYSGGKLSPSAIKIDKLLNGKLKKLIKQGDIAGSNGQHLLVQDTDGCAAKRILMVGCGKANDISAQGFRKITRSTIKTLEAYNIADAALFLNDIEVTEQFDNAWKTQACAEISVHAQYRYHQTKSVKIPSITLKKISINSDKKSASKCQRAAKVGRAIGQGMNLTRELGDLPANVCTPTHLASVAKKLARSYSMKATILNQKQIEEQKMGAFLSVAKGSREAPKFIILEYKGDKSKSAKAPIVLVGKGITFDAGGISIKPSPAMDEMKYDMGGAASVIGTFKTLGELQPKINVIALVPACENLPDGLANKPGDIVTSKAGLTIEVLNTDAEGRLILCDALTYSEKYKPRAVLDVATLTGACVIALGNQATGLLSNDQVLADKILNAGITSADRAWQMPLWDEYQDQLKSNFADIANIGGRGAGTITAACFLSRFTKKFKWAHLDIAGVAWDSGANKGSTGRPVPMLVTYILNEVGNG